MTPVKLGVTLRPSSHLQSHITGSQNHFRLIPSAISLTEGPSPPPQQSPPLPVLSCSEYVKLWRLPGGQLSSSCSLLSNYVRDCPSLRRTLRFPAELCSPLLLSNCSSLESQRPYTFSPPEGAVAWECTRLISFPVVPSLAGDTPKSSQCGCWIALTVPMSLQCELPGAASQCVYAFPVPPHTVGRAFAV